MTVGAVVVHYRTPDALAHCLDGLRRQGPRLHGVVVVDTGAAEAGDLAPPAVVGSREQWLPAPGNIGFGAAANLGAAALSTDAVLVLNADVVLDAGAIDRLAATLDERPAAAIAAPRIIDAAGEVELNARAFPTPLTGVLGRASRLTAILRRLGSLPTTLAGAESGDPRRVDWVSGACAMVRSEDWAALGGFEEVFWMYWEDADLCRRAWEAGRETWFEPRAGCRHATGSSGRSARTVRAFHRSAALYYERHLARTAVDRMLARALLEARCRLVLRRVKRSAA
jgi:N-acetylglucosaminyl-diphospho-decaprenol L-rhamnosyltransferase